MKRAFTLIELLVYMAIMGFIIVVAGRVFSDSTRMRVRSQGMLKSSEEIGKLATLINEDISQMGIKEWWDIEKQEHGVRSEVYWDIEKQDYSSYKLIREEAGDHLTFKKAVFNEKGEYLAIQEIAWYKSNDSLFRKCRSMYNSPNTTDNDCVGDVLIATNITNFRLTPYKSAEDSTLFAEDMFHLYQRTGGSGIRLIPNDNLNNDLPGNITEVSGFIKNEPSETFRYEFYLAKFRETPGTWNDCEKFKIENGNTYIIEFKMPFHGDNTSDLTEKEKYYNSTQFQAGKDHLSIGFRDNNNGDPKGRVSDILFYPPQGKVTSETRHLEFTIKEDAMACAAITFAFYSPIACDGIYEFSEFKVFRKAKQNFQPPPPEESDYGIGDEDTEQKRIEKKNTKAFELMLEIDHKGEKSGTYSQKERGMIIATPNNGITIEVETE